MFAVYFRSKFSGDSLVSTVKRVATGSRDRPIVYSLHKYYLN